MHSDWLPEWLKGLLKSSAYNVKTHFSWFYDEVIIIKPICCRKTNKSFEAADRNTHSNVESETNTVFKVT